MSYFKIDQVICSWECHGALYAVKNAEATDFYLKSGRGQKVPYRLLKNAIGWVAPHEIRLTNQQAYYHSFKPLLVDKGSTVIFCLFIREISKEQKVIGFFADKKVCVQLYSETGLIWAIEKIKNYDFPSYQLITNVGSFEIRHIMETFPISVDIKERSLTLDEFHICLKKLNGKTVTLVVTSKDTVATLKSRIEDKEGIPLIEQRLTYEGRQLEDNQTLLSCNIKHESSIHLLLRLRGGGPDAFSFNHMTHEKRVAFSEAAPKWRAVIPGLNLTGTCINKECVASGKRVVIPKGIGAFHIDLASHLSKCPCCNTIATNINNAGFYKCLYSVQGRKENGERVDSSDTRAPDNEVLTFKHAGVSLDKWDQLTITTKKVPSALVVPTDQEGCCGCTIL